jgi:diguanylate cyclase (GGDEF)-like protein
VHVVDRRADDRQWTIVMGETVSASEVHDEAGRDRISLSRIGPVRGGNHPTRTPVHGDGETVFLVDSGEEETVYLVAGASVRTLPRGDGGEELRLRAEQGAAAWRRQRARSLRRIDLPRRLLAFAEELGRARTRDDVLRAVTRHTAAIVGGYRAVIFVPGEDPALLVPFEPDDAGRAALWIERDPTFGWAGTVHPEEAAEGTGGPYAGLAPLFSAEAAARLAYVPLGDPAVLVLVERRGDRQFDAEDWELLEAISRQAATALERVDLFEQVRDLSLTDPLTGLANRRQLAVVMERSLAAARRGKPLAVVMIDLDGFKRINDEQGHPVADRMLCTVAGALQEEARGADLVVRYGGDEFLVVLPGGSRAGANALLERVSRRLAGEVAFTAGVAEFDAAEDSLEQLIQAADRDLYRHRDQAPRAPRNGVTTSTAGS